VSWWDRLVAAVKRLFGGSTVNAASSASVMIEVPDTVEVEVK
jgi:hypothetical protein